MKRKNGFTLIEVLTVIIVLAIIALIAVPIVMDLVHKANKSAFKDSAYALIKAGDLFYSTSEMEGAELARKTFDFSDDNVKLDVKGELPTGGIMKVYENGEIAMAVTKGKYCATKGIYDKEVTITEDAENCEIPKLEPGDIVYFDPTLGEKGMLCTEAEYDKENSKAGVNTGCMKWYVYDKKGEDYNLILDHNVTKDFRLQTKDNTNFISELMNQLNKDTKEWKVEADVMELEELLSFVPYYQNLSDEQKSNWYEGYVEKTNELLDRLADYMRVWGIENGSDTNSNLCNIMAIINEKSEEISNNFESGSIFVPSYFYNDLSECEWYYKDNTFVYAPIWITDNAYWLKTTSENAEAWLTGYEGIHIIRTAPVDLISSRVYHYEGLGIRPIITITQ